MRRPERDDRARDHGRIGSQRKVKARCHGGQYQRCFHHGKGTANADTWAAAEGKVSITWQTLGKIVGPALWPKGERIVEPASIAVRDPRAQDDGGPPWNAVTSNGAIDRGQTAEA